MKMRRDALCAAAEFVLAVEAQAKNGLVATVGMIDAKPGAGNVIPGMVTCSVDIRHESDAVRRRAVMALRKWKPRRGVRLTWETKSDVTAVACDAGLVRALTNAAKRHQKIVPAFVSGAGHDAAAMAAITPTVMLFVRCQAGISHNPAESVREPDVAVAAKVMCEFVSRL